MPDLTFDTLPDAEQQLATLAEQLRPHLTPDTALVGIYSGGAWVAERLKEMLGISEAVGQIDVSFYRDDFAEKGLHPQVRPSNIPFEVEGRPLILVDDVLYTGRTTRAAINELFDYGRPARVELAVLADRGERELPIEPGYCVWEVDLEEGEELILGREESGRLFWKMGRNDRG